MIRGFVILYFLMIISPLYSIGQEDLPGSGVGYESSILTGRIIRHSKKFTAPIPSLSTALDVNYTWQNHGKREWHQRRHFPQTGIGITYTGYGNNAVFGRAIGIYPNLQFALARGKNIEWTFRFGNGIAYISRKYQTTYPVDTVNNAIGSNINDFAIFMTDLRWHADDHWQLEIGANFTHISNTDFHQPNLGVNMAGTHIGIRYSPVTNRPAHIVRDLPKLKDRWLLEFRAGVAYNEARAKDSSVLPSYISTLYASRRWMSKNKFFFGIDYAYHNDVYAFLKNYGVDYGHEMSHSWDGAFFAGNEFLFGRLGLVGQVGVYYHQTFLKFDPVYEKIGGNFYIIQHEKGIVKEFFISAMLLTHEIVAQYGELGIGAGF